MSDVNDIVNLAQEYKIPLKLNTPKMISAFEKGLDKVLRREIETWDDVKEILNFVSMEDNGLLSKESREKLIMNLIIKMKDLLPAQHTQIEVELPVLRNKFENFLNSSLGKTDIIDQQLIRLLYNQLPLAEENLISEVRRDAIELNILGTKFTPIREIIHNHPSKENLILIRKFNEYFQTEGNKKELDRKYQELKSYWEEKYRFINRVFYSLNELKEMKNNKDIRQIFTKLQNDLEKMWSQDEALEEKIRSHYQSIPAELSELKTGIENILGEISKKENIQIAKDIGKLRLLLNEAIEKEKMNKAEGYILDRLLEIVGYKSYSEYLDKIEVNKDNLPQVVEVLKSMFFSLEADHLDNEEISRTSSILYELDLTNPEDLSKLKFHLSKWTKEIQSILDQKRKYFEDLIKGLPIQLSSKEKEELFSIFYRNNSLYCLDNLITKIDKFLDSINITPHEGLTLHENILRFHKGENNDF